MLYLKHSIFFVFLYFNAQKYTFPTNLPNAFNANVKMQNFVRDVKTNLLNTT